MFAPFRQYFCPFATSRLKFRQRSLCRCKILEKLIDCPPGTKIYFLFVVRTGVVFLVGSYLRILKECSNPSIGKFRLKIELVEREIVKNFRIECYV